MKQIIFALLLIAAVSCTQRTSTSSEPTNETVPAETVENIVSGKQCFLGVEGRDSVFLEMETNNNSFQGYLFYNRFESDSSIGEIQGTISGDTVKGVYTFMSEGMISVMDKYFLVKDGQLLEGFGELTQVNETTMAFTNPKDLVYDGFKLKETDCSSNFIPQSGKDMYHKVKNEQ